MVGRTMEVNNPEIEKEDTLAYVQLHEVLILTSPCNSLESDITCLLNSHSNMKC